MTEGWQPEWNDLIDKYFPKAHTDWDGIDVETLKTILDSQIKIEKITAFAKTLAYSNPHVSWQLKQLLLNALSKEPEPKENTSDAEDPLICTVTCSKCDFIFECQAKFFENFRKGLESLNEKNRMTMECVHDYRYKLSDQK